ncbi:MAG: ABC transporter ATP-binding protein, partial [Pseudomonadota bacterium]
MTLVVENLTIRRGEAILVDGVSFCAARGEFIGVVGPNGAGKSTLLRALAGLDRSASGSVTIGGIPIGSMTPAGRARARAYLPQIRETNWAMTAEAVVGLGRFAYGAPHRLGPADRAAVERALVATDSTSFRRRVASTLSGGEEARIHLARALAAEAPILIADEPTAALDLKHALSIISTLRTQADGGGLVIAALHDLDLARRHCTRIIALDRGR